MPKPERWNPDSGHTLYEDRKLWIDYARELEAVLTRLKRDPKLWKSGGAGGQDQFAGLPPALRLIHEVLPD